jgi:hypothetical protein
VIEPVYQPMRAEPSVAHEQQQVTARWLCERKCTYQQFVAGPQSGNHAAAGDADAHLMAGAQRTGDEFASYAVQSVSPCFQSVLRFS